MAFFLPKMDYSKENGSTDKIRKCNLFIVSTNYKNILENYVRKSLKKKYKTLRQACEWNFLFSLTTKTFIWCLGETTFLWISIYIVEIIVFFSIWLVPYVPYSVFLINISWNSFLRCHYILQKPSHQIFKSFEITLFLLN